MKGWIWGVIAGVLVVGLAVGFGVRALAEDEPSGPPHLVTVSGTATVSTAPDEAVVTLGVRSEAAESQRAFDDNAAKMDAVLQAVKGAGVSEKDIETTNVSLERHVEDRGTPRETTTYVAQNQVDVTVRNLDDVGAVIDAAVAAGADEVRDIRFELSDETQVREDALRAAVLGARSKAVAMADAAGTSVTGVVSIREQGTPEPEFLRAAAPFAGDVGAATPIVPPSDIETRVTVTVVWSLG